MSDFKNISDFRKHGLQKCSGEILGVNQSEIKPKLIKTT